MCLSSSDSLLSTFVSFGVTKVSVFFVFGVMDEAELGVCEGEVLALNDQCRSKFDSNC